MTPLVKEPPKQAIAAIPMGSPVSPSMAVRAMELRGDVQIILITPQQKSHENGRLLCSCRNHAADVPGLHSHSRIHQEGDESGNRCNHESTQHGIQARREDATQ